jgi:hypothetical protein
LPPWRPMCHSLSKSFSKTRALPKRQAISHRCPWMSAARQRLVWLDREHFHFDAAAADILNR